MNKELEDFNKANEVEHKVENQWHYEILKRYGFKPNTLIAKGFVRSYEYENDEGFKIQGRTGASADYFISQCGMSGFWSELEPFLKSRELKEKV
ncbi:MAG: hypothetical protein WCS33_00710 [Candidatus Caldatribacteriota bacterium]